jgi:hypothetical protein
MTSLVSNRIASGLAILGPAETALLRLLDEVFARWAIDAGANEISAPPVYSVLDLEKFDVYVNFPHLALVAGSLRASSPRPNNGRFEVDHLINVRLGLPTATCFGAYLFFENRKVLNTTLVTLVNRCFRSEDHFDGLRRLLTFQMREVVALGSYEHTQDMLTRFRERIEEFMRGLSLNFVIDAATDPFFERNGSRALLQRIRPVKYEFQVDGLAIASLNTHRNFFGERCLIKTEPDGGAAFTSCVAFGLERWVSVLLDRHGSATQALAAVERVTSEQRTT